MAFSKLRTWLRSHFSCKKKAQNGGKSFLLCCATFTVTDDEDEEMENDRKPSCETGDFLPSKRNHSCKRQSEMLQGSTVKDFRPALSEESTHKDIKPALSKEGTHKDRPALSKADTHKDLRSCSETKRELLNDKKSPVPSVSAKNLHKGCKSKCYLRHTVIYEKTEGFCPCPIQEIEQMKLQQLHNYQKRSRNFCIRYVDTEYIHRRMSLVSILGAGGFGFVYLVRDMERGIHLAAKIIPQKASSDAMIRTEIQILKTIKSNPLCIEFDSYVKYEVSPNVQKHFLFLKYFESCTLWHFPRVYCITTENIHFILGQIGMGLKYLHGVNIIHRDIKGDNILINDMCQIKLIDFGLSAVGTSFKGYCGTRYYEAPEVLIHAVEKDAKPYSFAADYYSLGISAYQLIYGTSPCDYKLKMFGLGENDSVCKKDAQREIAAGCIDYPPDCDESRQDVIRKLLVPDPEQRLGDKTYLSHSFFKGKVLKQLLKCGLKAQRKNPLEDDGKTKIPVVEGRDKLDDAVPSLANERLI